MRMANAKQQERECMLNSAETSNSAENGKKNKSFLRKQRHRFMYKDFFLKDISSSKGNTKGLYKFIFHITID